VESAEILPVHCSQVMIRYKEGRTTGTTKRIVRPHPNLIVCSKGRVRRKGGSNQPAIIDKGKELKSCYSVKSISVVCVGVLIKKLQQKKIS